MLLCDTSALGRIEVNVCIAHGTVSPNSRPSFSRSALMVK
jgi:hypothetical protein